MRNLRHERMDTPMTADREGEIVKRLREAATNAGYPKNELYNEAAALIESTIAAPQECPPKGNERAADNLAHTPVSAAPDLMPCPFCKREPQTQMQFFRDGAIQPVGYLAARCEHHTQWITVEQWNRRPAPGAEGDAKRLDWLDDQMKRHYTASNKVKYPLSTDVYIKDGSANIYVRDECGRNESEAHGDNIRAALDQAMKDAAAGASDER